MAAPIAAIFARSDESVQAPEVVPELLVLLVLLVELVELLLVDVLPELLVVVDPELLVVDPELVELVDVLPELLVPVAPPVPIVVVPLPVPVVAPPAANSSAPAGDEQAATATTGARTARRAQARIMGGVLSVGFCPECLSKEQTGRGKSTTFACETSGGTIACRGSEARGVVGLDLTGGYTPPRRCIMRSLLLAVAVVGVGAGCGPKDPGTTSASPCDAYQDPVAGSQVSFRIVNQRGTPVYVDTDCHVVFSFVVSGATHQGSLFPLTMTCQEAQSKPLPGAGDCGSAGTPIAPGGTWEGHWSGIFYDQETTMPTSCYAKQPSPPPSLSCVLPTAPAPGPMTVVAQLFATSTMTGGWPSVGDPIQAQRDFVFGTDTMVEIDVQ